MESDDPIEIQNDSDEELAAVTSLLPSLPDVRAAPTDRFSHAVRLLIEKRAQAGWPNEGNSDLAVFVLADYPREIGEKFGGVPFADPTAQCTPLLGRVFLSSLDASHGQFIQLPTEEHEILEWLEDNGLGDRTIITVYRKAKELIVRPTGTAGAANQEYIRDQKPKATIEELDEALQHYHKRQVLTPVGCPEGVWEPKSAQKYVPGPQPEKSIQFDLTRILNSWFRDVVWAEYEDQTNIGRIDVRLLERGATGGLRYWTILELKVIKTFTNAPPGTQASTVSDTSNVDAIAKGVRQAASFQENRDAEHGMLEVYDIRKDKTEDLTERSEVTTALKSYATPPKIDVWPMFGSAEDARKHGYTGV